MKRNKVYCNSIGGLKIASVDGTEIYIETIHCDDTLPSQCDRINVFDTFYSV
jgi:hypothetical protein